MIQVTQTYLPNLERYNKLVDKVYLTNSITNRGNLTIELEGKLKNKFLIDNVLLVTNGTLALQIAIKSLAVKGEIITTAYSYVATLSSIIWEGCDPVFVDIDPNTLTIDVTKIKDAITKNTSAILATHVYGNPCDVEEIAKIASTYNLKTIYDAAHCFGVTYKGKSIFSYGDVSICSFHATKIFHTGEGGALFTSDRDLYDQMYLKHNFGHKLGGEIVSLGINAKFTEIQAAMGLAMLPEFNYIKSTRRSVVEKYIRGLKDNIAKINLRDYTDWNYSYFPIICESKLQREKIEKDLSKKNIYGRRYFYPSLNKLPYNNNYIPMPISESIADRVLCLPLFVNLEEKHQLVIIDVINNNYI